MTTDLQRQIRETEYRIEACKCKVALYEKLEKLTKNKEFKELITEGYLRDECMNATALLANPAAQEGAMDILKGMSRLRQHLSTIHTEGYASKYEELEYHEGTLRDLRLEALSPVDDGE